uniref:Putative transposase, IS3 n=1 Tax=Magnetococcus massalia (strain MO-1) TaxID=451514 RepID=A0A1S7LF73_MAGMO|nr:Putative transposase, IS3 [Candidatus Magnetococcus massalia]
MAMDFMTVPTLFFDVLHVLIIVDHERRKIVHFGISRNPTAAWVAQQLREAFPWDSAPRYLIHDGDSRFKADLISQLAIMGINSVRTAPRSPWQNAICERTIRTLRRELFNHVIVISPAHLKKLLDEYLIYFHGSRTHLGLNKDTPIHSPIQLLTDGEIKATPFLGGLHHRYDRQHC